MSEQPISNEVALRIALAARVLPDVSIRDLLEILQTLLEDNITEETLNQITVTKLKTALKQTYDLDGEEAGEDANAADMIMFKEAVRILWGEKDVKDILPPLEPYQEGEMPGSIRVAVASNKGEQLDAHFGSALRYLVYQLSPTEIRLVDIRPSIEAELADDRNAFRVSLIRDCHVLYIVSIGGPAAAKVVQGGLYPMKIEEGGAAREVLADLQKSLASPPPWLAKVMGVEAGDRVKNYKAAV